MVTIPTEAGIVWTICNYFIWIMHRLNQSQIFQAKYVYSKSDPTATISTEICRACTNLNYLYWNMHKLNQLQLSHAKHGTYSNYIVHSLCQSHLFQAKHAYSKPITTISTDGRTIRTNCNYFERNLYILSSLQWLQLQRTKSEPIISTSTEFGITISSEVYILWAKCNYRNWNTHKLSQLQL